MTDKPTNGAPHPPSNSPQEGVVCPFCAMLCDDLSLPLDNGALTAEKLACTKARAGFSLALDQPRRNPMLNGREVDWPEAITHAQTLLEAAHLPVFHGLLGDLADCQGALRLAEHYGGVVDHADGDAMAVALSVFQDSGWITTSLGEVRNRADLFVLLGDSIDEHLPRFRERLFDTTERLHTTESAEVVTLAGNPIDILDEIRTLLHGRPLPAPLEQASELHTRIRDSRYPVFVPIVDDPPVAELIVRAAADLVRLLNDDSRAALLMLSPSIGSATAQHAGTWQGGFGIRTGFAAGYPEQDLHRHAAGRLLTNGEADLLVWISTLDAGPRPVCRQPSIVIGHPATQFDASPPDVFLPCAVPGVQRGGFMHRADGLHMLPLRSLVASDLPGTRQLIDQLLDASVKAN